ncbi:BCL7-like protein [Ditylenchus destructor]|uniref:BCL7-like protein n=1 Tax=Ditylenchus destructor TaxID=166010 RepID=A0AAD4NG73_9BILA|nr:BCL7-like protein [Ditylenchus destructor]
MESNWTEVFSGRASVSSTPSGKVFPRAQRAETRNRAKDELKRVINAVDKVRKWERRWVVLKDSSIHVFKWVPITAQSVPLAAPKTVAVKTSNLTNSVPNNDDTNISTLSAENSNDATNIGVSQGANLSNSNGNNEDSNAATYSEGEFGDSNQTETFDRVDYKREEGVGGGQTDFSAMVKAEAEGKLQPESSNPPTPASSSRKRKANGSPGDGESSRKRSK